MPDPFEQFGDLTAHHQRELIAPLRNPDGSISTVRTMVVGLDGWETIIPTIWEGKQLTGEEAVKRALKSGKKWPRFKTVDEALATDKAWHQQQGMYNPGEKQ